MLPQQEQSTPSLTRDWFTTTHWSVVLAARQPDTPGAQQALERLCQTYWYPLYVFIRHQGYSPDDAQDLTQAYFERVLARNYFDQADPDKGRFRAFLLARLKHFLSDQRDRDRAAKRGGGATVLSLDAQAAEQRYRLEPVDAMAPDRLYERRWAFTVLGEARERLKQEFVAAGKSELYEQVNALEMGEETGHTYAEVGQRLGMSVDAIKSAVVRLRRRYGELLRQEIAQTVATASEIDQEIRHLMAAIAE